MKNDSIIVLKANELRQIVREEFEKVVQPEPPDFHKEKMTVGEAAKYIQVSYETMRKWILQGKIRVHGQGRTRFLLKSQLIEDYKGMNK